MTATNHQRQQSITTPATTTTTTIKRTLSKSFTQRFPLSALLAITTLLSLSLYATPATAAVHAVNTYSKMSSNTVTSNSLVWETYDPKDSKQLQYAVEGGKYITQDEHYPIYVCRVTIDGAPTVGHTEKVMQRHVCVALHYKHTKYEVFDVLLNKGHLGKIAWKEWRTFSVGVPVGAVHIGDILSPLYVARHRAPHHQTVNTEDPAGGHWGADYNLGCLDPVGLGKIRVIENERDEKNYVEGEVLVDTQPFKYELRDIKLLTSTLDIRSNFTELATSVLANRGDQYGLVETVISYKFDHVQFWGPHEGAARGLPTTVFEKDAATPTTINWGLKHNQVRFETKAVNTKLWPGTALNVTLIGNYVTLDASYTAKLYAFYNGSEESISRKISSEVRKSYLKDVKLEFSPVYWIENGTMVPTTTTTSTTSTTTHATTTSTGEPTPMHEPPVVEVNAVGETHSGPDTLEKTLHDAPGHNNENNTNNEIPDNLKDKQTLAVAGIAGAGGSDGAAATTITLTLLAISAAATIFTQL